ncbi:MAG: hypothetical protein ACRYG8_16695 [Janthinobacterium lividum]
MIQDAEAWNDAVNGLVDDTNALFTDGYAHRKFGAAQEHALLTDLRALLSVAHARVSTDAARGVVVGHLINGWGLRFELQFPAEVLR